MQFIFKSYAIQNRTYVKNLHLEVVPSANHGDQKLIVILEIMLLIIRRYIRNSLTSGSVLFLVTSTSLVEKSGAITHVY